METEITLIIKNPSANVRYYVVCERREHTEQKETTETQKASEIVNDVFLDSPALAADQERILNRSRRNGNHCRCGKFLKQGVTICAKCEAKWKNEAWAAWSPAATRTPN
jgi:hypothetical protein